MKIKCQIHFSPAVESVQPEQSPIAKRLHLDQLIDVGWITSGEAAEDDQDLPACMSRHVPSYKDRRS